MAILGQSKSKKILGHVTWLSGIPDNHFGWRGPGYQHTRGLINRGYDSITTHVRMQDDPAAGVTRMRPMAIAMASLSFLLVVFLLLLLPKLGHDSSVTACEMFGSLV